MKNIKDVFKRGGELNKQNQFEEGIALYNEAEKKFTHLAAGRHARLRYYRGLAYFCAASTKRQFFCLNEALHRYLKAAHDFDKAFDFFLPKSLSNMNIIVARDLVKSLKAAAAIYIDIEAPEEARVLLEKCLHVLERIACVLEQPLKNKHSCAHEKYLRHVKKEIFYELGEINEIYAPQESLQKFTSAPKEGADKKKEKGKWIEECKRKLYEKVDTWYLNKLHTLHDTHYIARYLLRYRKEFIKDVQEEVHDYNIVHTDLNQPDYSYINGKDHMPALEKAITDLSVRSWLAESTLFDDVKVNIEKHIVRYEERAMKSRSMDLDMLEREKEKYAQKEMRTILALTEKKKPLPIRNATSREMESFGEYVPPKREAPSEENNMYKRKWEQRVYMPNKVFALTL